MVSSLGVTGHLGRIDTTGHLDQAYSLTEGSHQIRFGGEVRRSRLDVYYERNTLGRFTFDGSQTGDPLGDFLAMRLSPTNATISIGNRQRNYYLDGVSFFAQDSWKVRHNLTFNYGLNWLYQSPISDPKNTISTFRAAYGGTGIEPVTALGTLWPRDFGDFAPVSASSISRTSAANWWYAAATASSIRFRMSTILAITVRPTTARPEFSPMPLATRRFTQLPIPPKSRLSRCFRFSAIHKSRPGPFGAFSVSSHFKTAYAQNTNLNVAVPNQQQFGF